MPNCRPRRVQEKCRRATPDTSDLDSGGETTHISHKSNNTNDNHESLLKALESALNVRSTKGKSTDPRRAVLIVAIFRRHTRTAAPLTLGTIYDPLEIRRLQGFSSKTLFFCLPAQLSRLLSLAELLLTNHNPFSAPSLSRKCSSFHSEVTTMTRKR